MPNDEKNEYSMDDLMQTLKFKASENARADSELPEPLQAKQDLDELMQALENNDKDKVKMFIKQVKVDDMKEELKGLDPDRHDDIFDDVVTVHEVVKALEDYKQTGDTRVIELLVNQHEANKLKEKTQSKEVSSKIDEFLGFDE